MKNEQIKKYEYRNEKTAKWMIDKSLNRLMTKQISKQDNY